MNSVETESGNAEEIWDRIFGLTGAISKEEAEEIKKGAETLRREFQMRESD